MRTVAGGAVVAVVGLVAAGLAQPPAPPAAVKPAVAPAPAAPAAAVKAAELPANPAIEKLVRDLGAADYQTREAAGKELEKAGDKALPYLRKAVAETASAEVSRRAGLLVKRMEHERVVSPKRVTLKTKAWTAQEAFQEIGKQTGYRVDFFGGGADRKIDLGFDDVPFWQAVDALSEATGASVMPTGGDDDGLQVNMNVGGQPTRYPVVTYVGPFKLAATSVQMNRSVQLTGTDPRGLAFNRPSESVSLTYSLFSEPKVPLMSMNYQSVVLAAEDDQGGSMVPPRNDPNQFGGPRSVYYGGGGYRQFNLTGTLQLSRSGREARTIRFLKAKTQVTMLTGVVPEVTVRDPLKAKNLKVTGRSVALDLDGVTGGGNNGPGGGMYTASMTVRKLGPQDPNFPDYAWSSNIWQRVDLIDADGNKYRNFGPSNLNQNLGTVTMTVQFSPSDRRGMPQKFGPPVRLVLNEWVQSAHEITFEFKDVPLP